ncbi:MAG: multifunctional CCA addition/repair protein, partial [Gammaproteobacteria bacterium]|nr:multifunctional CCA addition/repair protein [Gammaproteobacteria bacterium]
KTASGYHGFEFNTHPDITIEEDLRRRDLTINAMAEDVDGNIIDPYGGQEDLDSRILRHVSEAFIEDPVRVLRVARFAARFHHLGFRLAQETSELIRRMGESGELHALVAERVWAETVRALGEKSPPVYFQTLSDCSVLNLLFPEIDDLFGVPQVAKHHPEIDTGVHVMMCLQKSADLGFDNETRFAVLMHDLGKATTPQHILPGHHGHEARGIKLVKRFCSRLKVPKAFIELALMTTEYHTHVHRAFELKVTTILNLFYSVDLFRKPQRFQKMLDACLADTRGRLNCEDIDYPQADFLATLATKLLDADISSVTQQGFEGKALGDAIREFRLGILKQEKANYREALKR